jgi:predicted dehydrogenase
MGQRHAKLISESKIAVVAGFSDPNPSAALNPIFAKVKHYRDHLKLIKAESPDGIIVAAPNAHHVPIAIDCLSAGIPVLVEKPVAENVESGNALVTEQRKSGVIVLVGHHRRFDPLWMPQDN